jgi:hypothetical protein
MRRVPQLHAIHSGVHKGLYTRIWDSLGFVRAGLIPRAGQLRRNDGSGEEWVDAIIYYRSFVDEDECQGTPNRIADIA